MKPRVLLLLTLLLPLTALTADFDHAHRAFSALLQKHVVSQDGGHATRVDYASLQRDRAPLAGYLRSLSAVTQAEFDGWSKARQMAFLINAYNGFTLELVLQNYPVKSIKDIGGPFSNPWKRAFFRLLGREFSLDGIEHDTLRKPGAYAEVRVHYALNCASIGCPALREEAYTADKLSTQLEEQAVRFLSDRSRNRYADGRLEVAAIFKWFADDWTSGYRGFDGRTAPINSREAYFARYAPLLAREPVGREQVAAGRAELTFLDYDWALNDVSR